jgi:hypothetical protein
MRSRSATGIAGMRVKRSSNSSIRLLKSGDRCWMTTKAMPESTGMARKKRSSASSPPADAPMPTTWLGRGRSDSGRAMESSAPASGGLSLSFVMPYP